MSAGTSITARELLARPTDAQIRAAAEMRVRQAMQHIQNAQDELDRACRMLSALTWGDPTYRACGKLRERVHALWYRVQTFGRGRRYSLDSTNIEALARELASRQ